MITYAGIGSRQITDVERKTIIKIAKKIADVNIILFSGNAEGSDVSFELGSEGKCVLLLPWKNFNKAIYDHSKCIAKFDCGETEQGIASIERFHPSPKSLSFGGKRMMSRNWHQIVGYDIYPRVSFVVCCTNFDENGRPQGGTGQAIRIAEYFDIPVVNIRDEGWQSKLTEVIKNIDKINL